MSVFCDFQQVWLQRFPESPLPGAWEEDVRANLAKHKQKVALLKEELEHEEFYVEYLERLLSDVEQHKKKLAKEKLSNEENHPEQLGVDTNVGGEELLSKRTSAELSAPSQEGQISNESFSAHMCINEISKSLKKSYSDVSDKAGSETDAEATFVTVIEVNGLNKKESDSPVIKKPPKIPARPDSLKNTNFDTNRSNSGSISSSSELIHNPDEPYYDMVAPEEDYLARSTNSSSENVFGSSSTLPLDLKTQQSVEPQSPGASNYVNIEYFIHQTKKNGNDHSSSEDEHEPEHEEPVLKRHTDNSSYASSSSLESTTPGTRRKFSHDGDSEAEKMYRSIIGNIISSESNYVEWLSVLLKYMKAIQATIGTSQPIVTETELNTIFYKIPELYVLHATFLDALKKHSQKWDSRIGDQFKHMALNISLYGAFLSNYGQALDTVRKCRENNVQFDEIAKNVTCKHLSDQPIALEDLLHRPVARVQKHALVLHDLQKSIPKNNPDYHSVTDALNLTQDFLDQFNMIQTKSMFPSNDRAQRRLVKNSFIVEYADGHRKLRHLFLFNDVIACAKYKSSGRNEKYTFELKWFIPVEETEILPENTANLHETPQSSIVHLKSQASNVRDQLLREEEINGKKNRMKMSRGLDKNRKKLMELESQLVLASPNLVYRMKHRGTGRIYTFFLSSDFERTQWIEAIKNLKKTERTGKQPTNPAQYNMFELKTWIAACREYLETNMGSYLLRSGNDESLLFGDLYVTISDLSGLEHPCDIFVCLEVDCYGHFFQKAKTKLIKKSLHPHWNENVIIELEGSENLRILIYQLNYMDNQEILFGKATIKLSRNWLSEQKIDKQITVSGCVFRMDLRYVPYESSTRHVPSGKAGSLFGEKIQLVCKRQKRDVPFIITACIREVERRGMSEIGVYRVSGSASDILKLKKSFETNSYEAEQLLKEVDIHSVAGILRLYLRELPEALFTDQLYPELLEAFNHSNGNLKRRTELLKDCFEKLPKQNKESIKIILDHLIRVHTYEDDNKMSLHNLATVFGPTLLRPAIKSDSAKKDGQKQRESLATGTVDVMAQAGILYCYLQDLNAAQGVRR